MLNAKVARGARAAQVDPLGRPCVSQLWQRGSYGPSDSVLQLTPTEAFKEGTPAARNSRKKPRAWFMIHTRLSVGGRVSKLVLLVRWNAAPRS